MTIDVLRWSTTAIAALASGASAIEAFATPAEAQARAAAIGALTAGERGGLRLPGFDLGNSPLEMTPERVRDRVLCCSTTNGTRALLSTASATHRFVAAFVNLSATAAAIRALAPQSVDIVCAGSEGQPSAEDSAAAAALAAALEETPLSPDLVAAVARAPHAALLRQLGFGEDVEFAARVDGVPVVARCIGDRIVGEGRGGHGRG